MSQPKDTATPPPSSPSGVRTTPSGFYVTRPSISRFIEKAIASVTTEAGHVVVRLDVLSDHQIYSEPGGPLRGVFVVTATPAPVGASLTMDLRLPWGETMEVPGEVEWVLDVPKASLRHRPGMGVRFDLLPQQLALLDRAMRLREPMEIPADVRRS